MAPDRPARERQCAEMLCSVLRNAPELRLSLLKWLGSLVGVSPAIVESCHWDFETERAVGAKRDDLRIEGRDAGEPEDRLVVLWTAEIKVAAQFHTSSLQNWDDDGVAADCDQRVEVSQIENYDRWLASQSAPHRAGFVLAKRDEASNLPSGLRNPWRCLTWTRLAEQVEECLAVGKLPGSDALLGSHMAGFVREHLWSSAGMANPTITFDDVALMRAFSAIGIECLKKVSDLVDSLRPVLEESGAINGPSKISKTLFQDRQRCVASGDIKPDDITGPLPYLELKAGVEGDSVVVYIESAAGHASKAEFRRISQQKAPALHRRNADWAVEAEDGIANRDLTLSKPLWEFLACEDQQQAVHDFVTAAINDLREAGVIDAIHEHQREIGGRP